MKNYNELINLDTFEERFEYLKTESIIGNPTFGYERYLNQYLYGTTTWRRFRNQIILRDGGCDLAVPDYLIFGGITIHHIVAITPEDIKERSPLVFDPNNVVCTSNQTHRLIHYSAECNNPYEIIERSRNDTIPWKR